MHKLGPFNNKPDKPPVKGLAKAPEPALDQLKKLLHDKVSLDLETDDNAFGASVSTRAINWPTTYTWKTFSTPRAPTGHTQLLPLPSPYGVSALASLIQAQRQLLARQYYGLLDTGEPMPKLQAENKFGEIEAFRIWKVKDAILYSVYARTPWEPGEVLKAHKPVQDVDTPAEMVRTHNGWMYERTGVHAFKSLYIAIHYGLEDDQTLHGCLYAVGKVKLWGDVVEHDRGYRAEFARIVEIVEVIDSQGTPYPDCAKVVRKRYTP